MLFPKKLIPNTENDILKEISNELDIPLKDVKKTYNIWIEYIEDIVKNTNQSVINFSGLGKMYLSYNRLKGNKDKEWENIKKEKIENDIPKDKNNDHKTTVPISIVYGVGRKNYKIGKNNKGFYDFFTKDELIRRQNISFFEEDRDFNDRKEIFNEFFNDIEEQKINKNENN